MRSRRQIARGRVNALLDTIKALILAALAIGYIGIISQYAPPAGSIPMNIAGVMVYTFAYFPPIVCIAMSFYYLARKKAYE